MSEQQKEQQLLETVDAPVDEDAKSFLFKPVRGFRLHQG